ncbi:MAG: hypothetical protein R2843_04340 [Thermomicrobiales bacterium]
MAGKIAEQLVFDEQSTGASNDIERATGIARRMVTEFGMSEKLGPLALGKKDELVFLGREISEQRNYSETIAYEIDMEVRRLIDEAAERARVILVEQFDKLEAIANLLIREKRSSTSSSRPSSTHRVRDRRSPVRRGGAPRCRSRLLRRRASMSAPTPILAHCRDNSGRSRPTSEPTKKPATESGRGLFSCS